MVFTLLPMEMLGGWHDVIVQEIRKIGSALSRQIGGEKGEVIRHIVQRMSVLLIKGNAALILNRTPSFPQPYLDGIQ